MDDALPKYDVLAEGSAMVMPLREGPDWACPSEKGLTGHALLPTCILQKRADDKHTIFSKERPWVWEKHQQGRVFLWGLRWRV